MFSLGTLRNSKFYTNKGVYNSDYNSSTTIPIVSQIKDNKSIIFFDYFIFNSILEKKINNEYIIKNKKYTVCYEELEYNKLYTFIIDKDTPNKRVVKIYKLNYDGILYKFLNSYLSNKENEKNKNSEDLENNLEIKKICLKNKNQKIIFPGNIYLAKIQNNRIQTSIGSGTFDAVKNYAENDKFFVILYRIEDQNKYHFIDLGETTNKKIDCLVYYENKNLFGVKNLNISGIIYKPQFFKVGDIVELRIKGRREGKLIFENWDESGGFYKEIDWDLSVPFDSEDVKFKNIENKAKIDISEVKFNNKKSTIENDDKKRNKSAHNELKNEILFNNSGIEKEKLNIENDYNIEEYIRKSFLKDKLDTIEWLKNNRKHIKYSIPIIYELYKENGRIWVEKLIKTKEEYDKYLEIEIKLNNKEFIRNIFRKGLKQEWCTNEIKEWFKRWIEWDDDKDSVKKMAIEYVSGMKK